jgi:hypothetical protein
MKMFLLGVAIIAASLFFLKNKLPSYRVEKEGSIVNMRIITLPASCEFTKSKYFMDVEYAGQMFNKRIPAGYCKTHKPGDTIKMKYLEGQESILFPDEKVGGDFIAIGLFLAVGILSLFIGIFYKGE